MGAAKVLAEAEADAKVAEEAKKEADKALPRGWQCQLDGKGRIYYYQIDEQTNQIQGKTSWERPSGSKRKVFQPSIMMGAAISCFEGATAIQVPRTRMSMSLSTFHNDLLALRSDAYKLNDKGSCLELVKDKDNAEIKPLKVKLEDAYYMY